MMAGGGANQEAEPPRVLSGIVFPLARSLGVCGRELLAPPSGVWGSAPEGCVFWVDPTPKGTYKGGAKNGLL